MARETIGYTRLEWNCPNCGTKNPGPQKTCLNCGGPQPENVSFQQADQNVLLTDKEEIEKAKAGADIHCPFCGTRNPAGTTICSQCGGNIKEGMRRASGTVIGAFQDRPQAEIKCERCGSLNPASAVNCQKCGAPMGKDQSTPPASPLPQPASKSNKTILIIIGAAFLFLCIAAIALISFLNNTEGVRGTVDQVIWTRSIAVEMFGPVNREGWRENVPSDAVLGTCEKRYHHSQSDPVADAEKICGTPYTVDQGSGYGEVVQDCEYRVYLDYCQYTIDDWKVVDTVKINGNDNSPSWPNPPLANNQRFGQRDESYTIRFSTSNGDYQYQTTDADLFTQCRVGSKWILNINPLGSVLSIEPAN